MLFLTFLVQGGAFSFESQKECDVAAWHFWRGKPDII